MVSQSSQPLQSCGVTGSSSRFIVAASGCRSRYIRNSTTAMVHTVVFENSVAGLNYSIAILEAWFNMSVGWQCKQICFQCHMTNKNYLQFPSPLLSLPERDPQSFMACLKPDSRGCRSPILSLLQDQILIQACSSICCIVLGTQVL